MKIRIAAGLLLMSSSAMAAGSSAGYGGGFAEVEPVVKRYNASGELFRIEGRCHLSCTSFLGIRNVCIDPGSIIVFHDGHDRGGHDRQRKNTVDVPHHLMSAYNASLRSYLQTSGANTVVSGNDMINRFGYRGCPAK
jgi:hypothetical protein